MFRNCPHIFNSSSSRSKSFLISYDFSIPGAAAIYAFLQQLKKIVYLVGPLHEGCVKSIEILDLECVLCHVTGVQNENKNALINPPSWIFPRSVVYKMSWGEFNLPL